MQNVSPLAGSKGSLTLKDSYNLEQGHKKVVDPCVYSAVLAFLFFDKTQIKVQKDNSRNA